MQLSYFFLPTFSSIIPEVIRQIGEKNKVRRKAEEENILFS